MTAAAVTRCHHWRALLHSVRDFCAPVSSYTKQTFTVHLNVAEFWDYMDLEELPAKYFTFVFSLESVWLWWRTFFFIYIIKKDSSLAWLTASDSSAEWTDITDHRHRCTDETMLPSLSTFHTEDRKGLKQTSFLNDSGKHFFADIVYSQNVVFEKKKDETKSV